jgi:predicted aminopeptidase
MRDSQSDQVLFSKFISEEIKSLRQWYVENKGKVTLELKTKRLAEIQEHFTKNLKPKLKTQDYEQFTKEPLNNARILLYDTYVTDLSDFETAFKKQNGDFKKFLEFCKTLEKSKKPEADLLL